MRINMKSLTTLLFTGLFLQTFVFSNIHATPTIMKLSPFYNAGKSTVQPAFPNLVSIQTPTRH